MVTFHMPRLGYCFACPPHNNNNNNNNNNTTQQQQQQSESQWAARKGTYLLFTAIRSSFKSESSGTPELVT
jgi:hypothetical protein